MCNKKICYKTCFYENNYFYGIKINIPCKSRAKYNTDNQYLGFSGDYHSYEGGANYLI